MSYPRQDSVALRLQAQNLRALDKLGAQRKRALMYLWTSTARLIKADIADAVRGSGKWTLPHFQQSGMYHRLSLRVSFLLGQFRVHAATRMKLAFKDLRAQSALRVAYLIDQTTPASRNTRIPSVSRNTGREASAPAAGWEDSWSEWVNAWGQSLMTNLRMNALNEGTLADAVAEVDATRANTPAYTLDAALSRLYDYWAAYEVAGGMHQAFEDNPDLAEAVIWRTRGDLRVCDECDANEGLTEDEADGEIPLHPNCNCFWQIVPPSFAALLRNGDEADRELARRMDAEGLAPNAMAVLTDDGDVAGKVVVDFDDWAEAQGAAVSGR